MKINTIRKPLYYIVSICCLFSMIGWGQIDKDEKAENKIKLKMVLAFEDSWGVAIGEIFIKCTENDYDYDILIDKTSRLISNEITDTNTKNGISTVNCKVVHDFEFEIRDDQNNIIMKYSKRISKIGNGEAGSYSTNNSHDAEHIHRAKKEALSDALEQSEREFTTASIEAIINSKILKNYVFHVNSKRSSQNLNNVIIWSAIMPNEINQYSDKPFVDITKKTQKKIDSYLEPNKPLDINSQIPPAIPNPTIPAPPTLTKTEFETKEMFNLRVIDELNKRELEIRRLQEKYRNDVIKRNNKLEILKTQYDKSIESIKSQQEYKKSILNSMLFKFTTNALYEVMGRPILENLKYDAETETMFADIKASNAFFLKKISFKIPISLAQDFKTNIDDVFPIVSFLFKDDTLQFDGVQAVYKSKTLVATLTDKSFIPEKVEVTLKDNKIEFNSNDQKNLTLQNPNLIDKFSVSAINYSEKDGKHNSYNDDLSGIITQYKPKEVNQKKWLFVVAVENYDYADKINYVENSAVSFKKTAQKVFGISDRNTYALIESNATAGAIEGNLSRMLENVKEDDTIYFYYSGHGVPSPASGEAYILPKDSIVDYITTKDQFQLSSLYKKLSDSKASKIISFTDCCFSGKTDNIMNFKGVAPGLMRSKSVSFNESKMVVITAGKNTQFSNQYLEKGHRLFSYFLIKSLLTRNGLDVMDIYKDLSLKVKDTSNAVGDAYRQEPQIYGNTTINLL